MGTDRAVKARTLAFAVLLGCAAPAAAAQDWTPHAAAALLDATFPTAQACQRALDDARRRESRAAPVNGLSYTHLFEQGRCQSSAHQGTPAWRIRMHWTPRAGSGKRRAQTH
ncbi:hypothetical protein [Sphingomonas panacis]|uniref:hypothetical protein n=1 Tax=Sphingomonas panacis TaxID=1560345 RepID=UPI0012372B44|nr:hypothetical protein [Sphingomonas panacis]